MFAGGSPLDKVQTINSDVLFTEEQASLANGAAIDTGFIDGQYLSAYQFTVIGDASGFNLEQTYKMEEFGTELQATFPISTISSPTQNVTIGAAFLQRFLRLRFINNSGSAITNVRVEVRALPEAEGATRTPLSIDPVAQSQALLTQSVVIGQDAIGSYQNARVNEIGALLSANFGIEVARGLYDGYKFEQVRGRNPDIDTSSTPEDLWNGSISYTGFNAVAGQEVSAASADNNDQGLLVSSGTATGGTTTTITDSAATFVTDGVAVGDIVLDDTQGIFGYVSNLTETEITVFNWINGDGASHLPAAGDTYRVATANNTGAAVIMLENPLDANLLEVRPIFMILNGTTTVTTSGESVMRLSKGRVLLSGSSERNEGEITIRQAVTTANIFCVMPTFGITTIGVGTIPANKFGLLVKYAPRITRVNGSSGSATFAFNVRKRGSNTFNAVKIYEIQTGGSVPGESFGAIVLEPGSDYKGTIEGVSDNNTVAEADAELFLVDV